MAVATPVDRGRESERPYNVLNSNPQAIVRADVGEFQS